MKARTALGCWALAVAAGLLAPTVVQAQVDNYKCYGGADLRNPRFSQIIALQTSDQFETTNVDVKRLKYVCTPTSVEGSVVNDPDTHLICYQIKGNSLASRPKVEVSPQDSTQFQVSRFQLRKPRLLCVPGAKTVLP